MAQTTQQAAAPKIRIPDDAQFVKVGDRVVALFDLNGVTVSYTIDDWSKFSTKYGDDIAALDEAHQTMTAEEFRALNVVHAGKAEELSQIQNQFGSYGAFWDSILDTVMGGNKARRDPEIRRVLAEFAARPDMDPAELQNKLEATKWYQERTQDQIEWNDLSQAEREKRISQTRLEMMEQWRAMTGKEIRGNDPRIENHVRMIAQGGIGLGSWTYTVVRPAALQNGESPYARELRGEAEEQRQRGVDIENTAENIRNQLEAYGLRWDTRTIDRWARAIVEKRQSDADLIGQIQGQAKIQYSWLPEGMETQSAAAPWLETYSRVMEKEANLFTPEVQAALTAGKPVWEFEQELKKSDAWLETKNAQGTMSSMIADLGRRMGFE